MAAKPTEGGPAPDFRLPRDDGGEASLADFAGRKLVLFFYPKADTPGCTREAQAFSALKPEFAAVGADILGVSADPVKKQNAFKTKHGLAVPLASDETTRCSKPTAYGEKSRCMARPIWELRGRLF